MQHDKTKVYLITMISVLAIVFLVTLFVSTIEPTDKEPVEPLDADVQEKPPSKEPPFGHAEETSQGEQVPDGP